MAIMNALKFSVAMQRQSLSSNSFRLLLWKQMFKSHPHAFVGLGRVLRAKSRRQMAAMA
jgi:hypothetical protein